MRHAVCLLAFLAIVVACGRKPPQPPKQQPPGPILSPDQIPRRDVTTDLADIGHGSVVVDRTGELTLAASAFNAIDSDLYSSWVSPPDDVRQSATIALGTKCRIERVGVDFGGTPLPDGAVRTMLFESSLDGKTFTPLATQTINRDTARQLIAVKPAEATHLRATMLDTFGDTSSAVAEIMAEGSELASWQRPNLTGEWTLNNDTASFVEAAGQVFGKVWMNPPMILEGGWEGRMLRFFWLRPNNEWGYGLFTVTRDGTKLNGIFWHESPISRFLGEVWFGEKSGVRATVPGDGVMEAWLVRYRSAPLYALSFQGDELDPADSAPALNRVARIIAAHPQTRFALVAYEVRETDAPRATARARHRLDSLLSALKARNVDLSRVEARVEGNDRKLIQNDEMQREIHSRIDLERK